MPPVDGYPSPDVAPDNGELTEIAYAKVNLALHVRDRRDDGYHSLESLFIFASDGDVLTGRTDASSAITLTIAGAFADGLDNGGGNLVVKAAQALCEHLGEERGAALTLVKTLPVASGIGGGSADAAATLRLLCRLWSVQIAADDLERIALSLGSDVPACLASATRMVRGRGEVLEDVDISGLPGTPMLLVNPGVGMSTARVFQGWDRVDRGALLADNLDRVITCGRNDLEPAAVAMAPVIADVLAALRQCSGVRVARMSGSGATCFALFDDEATADAAAAIIQARQADWWVMETRIRPA